MARALSLPIVWQEKRRDKNNYIPENLAGSVRDNYLTFYSWPLDNRGSGQRRTLADRLLGNYATFTQWGK
jgi:hypothetical protein